MERRAPTSETPRALPAAARGARVGESLALF